MMVFMLARRGREVGLKDGVMITKEIGDSFLFLYLCGANSFHASTPFLSAPSPLLAPASKF